ncbi:glutamic acid-rich protein-like [Leptopilina heterotoma]|uniref:glutamic acid-rich protein-like n=1 Tax=Leptopilina heterotoma TaxID=63436 RepID=UPI001CAA2D89|nr:glutamic acid-rich protein-like [Leptopilina heterotoma]
MCRCTAGRPPARHSYRKDFITVNNAVGDEDAIEPMELNDNEDVQSNASTIPYNGEEWFDNENREESDANIDDEEERNRRLLLEDSSDENSSDDASSVQDSSITTDSGFETSYSILTSESEHTEVNKDDDDSEDDEEEEEINEEEEVIEEVVNEEVMQENEQPDEVMEPQYYNQAGGSRDIPRDNSSIARENIRKRFPIQRYAKKRCKYSVGDLELRKMSIYENYYTSQVGRGGVSQVYVGSAYQRGHGIGSFLGGLFRRV